MIIVTLSDIIGIVTGALGLGLYGFFLARTRLADRKRKQKTTGA